MLDDFEPNAMNHDDDGDAWLDGLEFMDSGDWLSVAAGPSVSGTTGNRETSPSASGSPHNAGPRLQLFRCLDPTHASPCAGCVPAPLAGEEDDYEIVAGAARQGQRLLRTQLTATQEWGSELARNQLADSLEAAGDTILASELRAKRSARLTKANTFLLLRAWGYQSSLWHRHGRASRQRGEAERQRAAVVVQEQAPPASLLGPRFDGVAAFGAPGGTDAVVSQLEQLTQAATKLLAGEAGLEAALAPGGAGYYCDGDCAEVERGAALLAASAAAWETLAPVRRTGGPDTPAWLSLRGAQTGVEAQLNEDEALLRGWACANCYVRFFAIPQHLEALRAGEIALSEFLLIPPNGDDGPGVPPPVDGAAAFAPMTQPHAAAAAAFLREMYHAIAALSELCVRLHAVVSYARAFGTASSYEAAAELAVRTMTDAFSRGNRAMLSRAAWMRQHLVVDETPSHELRRLLIRIPMRRDAHDV